MVWPRLVDPGSDLWLVVPLLFGVVPWVALMMWATYRGTGLLMMDEALMAEYRVREAHPLVLLPLLLAGWAVCVLGGFYAAVGAFALVGLPPEGPAFLFVACYVFGNTAMMPPALLHLWTSRHLWRHGGLYARRRRVVSVPHPAEHGADATRASRANRLARRGRHAIPARGRVERGACDIMRTPGSVRRNNPRGSFSVRYKYG